MANVEKREMHSKEQSEWRSDQARTGDDPMTHDAFAQKISMWLDDELSPAEATELQAHLAGCPLCRHTYQVMKQVDSFLFQAATLVVSPEPGFDRRLDSRLAHYKPASRRRTWLGMGVLLLGTMFFFLVGAALVGAFVLSGPALLDVSLISTGLAELVASMNTMAVWLNLINLILKVSLLTMSQPFFWVTILVAIASAWLWVRVLNSLFRRASAPVEFMI